MISIIIPAYNEENRICKTIEKISEFINHKEHEIIVVNDGSNDKTIEFVNQLNLDNLKIVNNPGNKGKGYAVRNGMLHAQGDLLLYSDADLSTPIEELDKFIPFIEQGYDIVIGSRAMKESNIKKHQPMYREAMGKVFNKIVQAVIIRGINDTQCGFKLFTKESANRIFNLQRLDRFSFDVELLFLAKKFGFRIKEVPVTWINDEETKVSSVKDSVKMFVDLMKLRWLHAKRKEK